MKFLVITDAHLIEQNGKKVAYAPYVKEMNLWMPLVDQTTFVCPSRIDGQILARPFKIQDFRQLGLRRLEFHTLVSALLSFFTIPYQTLILWNEMRKADHIHLRCPGNLALLGCMVQILFPWKKKTVKYAGNWDPKAKQPMAYNIQKWILSSTFLTRNMQVLVYGDWNQKNKNIKPFFTATYHQSDISPIAERSFAEPLKALFVGTMGVNKRPLETVQLIENLTDLGLSITLDMYGDGSEQPRIKKYILENNLEHIVTLHGNQTAEVVTSAYKKSDLLVLLSQSEGWPKVIAEAMFWGVIPISTSVSAVPWMLGEGTRGFLINNVQFIKNNWLLEKLKDSETLKTMSAKSQEWSRQYTLDTFETEIKKLLK